MTLDPDRHDRRNNPMTLSLEPNVFEVDETAIRRNLAQLRTLVGQGCDLYAALKCNAYGFGLVSVGRLLEDAGVDAISVARLRDAIALREAGVGLPILLYAGAVVSPEYAMAIERFDLIPTVLDREAADVLSRQFTEERAVFVKVDVGHRRLGVEPARLVTLAVAVAETPKLRLDGIYTHLAVPPDPVPTGHVERQFELFEACLREASEAGLDVRVRMAASSSVLRLSDRMNLNAVDPGLMYFGLVNEGPAIDKLRFEKALRSLRSRLLQVKVLDDDPRRPDPLVPVRPGMRIGVFALGTSDGLGVVSGPEVLVRGRRAPLIEPISLEHCRVDLSGVPDAKAGDEVVVIGRQGGDEISTVEVVEHRGLESSRHNIAINIRDSVQRVYVS